MNRLKKHKDILRTLLRELLEIEDAFGETYFKLFIEEKEYKFEGMVETTEKLRQNGGRICVHRKDDDTLLFEAVLYTQKPEGKL